MTWDESTVKEMYIKQNGKCYLQMYLIHCKQVIFPSLFKPQVQGNHVNAAELESKISQTERNRPGWF